MMIQIDRNPSATKLRQFSAAVIALAAYILIRGFWLSSDVRGPSSIVTPAFQGSWFLLGAGAVGLVFPKIARLPFLALSYLTFPIGFVFSYVVLLLVYFGMIVPTGIWMRIIGRDRMRIRSWKHSHSFWRERRKPADLGYYLRQ